LFDAATKLRHLTFSSSSFSDKHEVSMSLEMGSQVVNSGPIAGLQKTLTKEHLKRSREM
jgi:hypothetical protein